MSGENWHRTVQRGSEAELLLLEYHSRPLVAFYFSWSDRGATFQTVDVVALSVRGVKGTMKPTDHTSQAWHFLENSVWPSNDHLAGAQLPIESGGVKNQTGTW